jgi:hypothetical protein
MGVAATIGCTGSMVGAPYGEADDTKGREASTTGAALDGGSTRTRPPHRTTSDTSATTTGALLDAGVEAGATAPATTSTSTTTTPSPTSTCGQTKGTSCEDCCWANLPGAQALSNAIDSEYFDCLDYNQCFGDPGCESYCNDSATNDQCGAQPTLCHEIDNCIDANACYK